MKLLLILYVIQVKALDFSTIEISNITQNVLEKYHTTCLYILQQTKNQGYLPKREVEFVQFLNKHRNLQIATISIEVLLNNESKQKCNENLPLYLVHTDEQSVKTHLQEFSTRSIFPSGRWLMFLSKNIEIDSYFNGINIPYNCEFTIVQRTPQDVLSLIEIYRNAPSQPLQKHILATSFDNRLQWTHQPLLERRSNLSGVTIRVSVYPEEGMIINEQECKKTTRFILCLRDHEIWMNIARKTNVKSTFVPYTNKNVKVENKIWTDAFAQLITNTTDVAISTYGMTPERFRVISYISNAFPQKVTTFIKKQKASVSRWEAVLQPFSTTLWWVVFCSILILTAVLSTTWYLTVRMTMATKIEDYSLNNTWIVVIGSLCQQGYEHTPQKIPCRLVFLTAYMTYLIIFAVYSTIFVSFLAVHIYQMPFTDFQGILDIGTYRFGTLHNKLYVSSFENADNPAMRKLYEKYLVEYDSLPRGNMAGIRRLCQEERYAFTMGLKSFTQLVPECDVIEVPRASFYIAMSFMIAKDSPYKRLFSHHMENLRRFGIIQRTENTLSPLLKGTQTSSELPHTQATMEEVLPMFIILLAGFIFSVMSLAAEILRFKHECLFRLPI